MNEEDVIALANLAKECGADLSWLGGRKNHPSECAFILNTEELLEFAKAIQDKQREDDAKIVKSFEPNDIDLYNAVLVDKE